MPNSLKYLLVLGIIPLFLGLTQQQSLAQAFTLETYNQGIEFQVPASTFGNGVCVYDFNQDGWDDLTFCNNGELARFFVNNNGIFESIELDTDFIIDGDSKQILWVDYDNDGDKDMFVANYEERIVLLRNDGDLSFTDVSQEAGLYDENVRHYGAAWGDVDNDGDLDLYVGKYHNPAFESGYQYMNHIYRNDGDGTFTEMAQPTGVSNGVSATFQSIFFDYNLDGYQDIYLINDRFDQQNYLYRNNGDWTFTDVTGASGLDLLIDAMCIAPADFDGDGDLDIYISNTFDNHLMENSNGYYTNVGSDFGVLGGGISWGALWMDHDLDMDLDLFVSNTGNVGTIELQNSFYENLEVFFLEDYEEFGLDEDVYGTYSCAMGDFNNDGHPDFAEGNNQPSDCQIYYNTGTSGRNWVKVSVEGTISNRDGIGSWIKVYVGGICQTQYTFAGENYISQNSHRKMFGLNNYPVVDSVEIGWLSGINETYYDLPANDTYHFIEGSSFSNEIVAPVGLNACNGDSVLLDAGDFESFLWSTGDSTQTIYVSEPGSYAVTVTNEFGISIDSDSVMVSISPILEAEIESIDVQCSGDATGSAQLLIAGEIMVNSILWSTDDSGLSVEDLMADTYQVFIEHGENCTDSLEFVINEPSAIQILVDVNDVLCFGDSTGSFEVDITGGILPYTIDLDGYNPAQLSAGEYVILVTDSLGCIMEASAVVNEPDELTGEISITDITDSTSGSANLEVSGGTEPYSIEWSTGDSTNIVTPLDVGEYWVEVVDTNGCVFWESFSITDIGALPHSREGIAIYPVPFSESFYIDIPFSHLGGLVRAYSLSGTLLSVKILTAEKNELITTHWATGTYLIQVSSQETIQYFKVVKH